jgi:hypothetical protein
MIQSDDFDITIGDSGGETFVRIVHIPTGIRRTALRRESSHELLLDEVLTELWADRIGNQRGG